MSFNYGLIRVFCEVLKCSNLEICIIISDFHLLLQMLIFLIQF